MFILESNSMLYFKFIESEKISSTEKDGIFWIVLSKILSLFIPKSNPDFDKQIDLANEWYIEYNDTENYIEREIGLDEKRTVILKMPYKKNYGFWLDTDLEISYFYARFKAETISEDEFLKKWNEFE